MGCSGVPQARVARRNTQLRFLERLHCMEGQEVGIVFIFIAFQR